jgi:putative phosphoesterase
MKIAVLADIHGNIAALRQVLAAARDENVERLFVLGDMVGYYYAARDVIHCLKEWPINAIRGNHERSFAETLENDEAAKLYRKRYGSALDVARETLDPQDIDWLAALADRTTVRLDGLSFELCHGSPRNADEYIYPNAAEDILDACRMTDRDMVLIGHTHYPMLITKPRPMLVNPGSVGQARDIGGFACWALIDTQTQTVMLKRTAYSTCELVEEARRRDPHLPYLVDVLHRGSAEQASTAKNRQ